MKVAVIGENGMLGSSVIKYLKKDKGIDLDQFPRVPHASIESSTIEKRYDYIVNCAGYINHVGEWRRFSTVLPAVDDNVLFPIFLESLSRKYGCKIIQIATDGVFSGKKGGYTEADEHDAEDIYGKTKSLGEMYSEYFYNIRCSIIGPGGRNKSLFKWVVEHPKNATVFGYTNHFWNGVTTLQFAKFCHNIIVNGIKLPNVIHAIPSDRLSKSELIKLICAEYRSDIQVIDTSFNKPMDRTLDTLCPAINETVWGRPQLTILEMIREMKNDE